MKITSYLKKASLLACSAFLVAGLFSGCGLGKIARERQMAESGGQVNLKLAYQLPADHYVSQNIENFVQKVKNRSNGSITITTYPAGQLYTDKNMNEAIVSGGLDMGLNSTAMWSTVVPALKVLDLPYLYLSYDAVARAMTGSVGATLTNEMEKKGVHPVIWVDYGYVQYLNNQRPIQSVEDMKGLQLRGYGAIPAQTIKALGASPVSMGSGEVYMAMQRGTIDGLTSSTAAMYERKFYEVGQYLSMTNHEYCEFVLAMNSDAWNRLSPEQRKIIEEAARETEADIRAETKAADQKGMEDLRAAGVNVFVLPESMYGPWIEATQPVRDEFIRSTGDIGKQLVQQSIAANQ